MVPIEVKLSLIDRERLAAEEAAKPKQKVKSIVQPVFVDPPVVTAKTEKKIEQEIENPITFVIKPMERPKPKDDQPKRPTSMSEIKIPGPGGG